MVIEYKGKTITLDERESRILLWYSDIMMDAFDDGGFVDEEVDKAVALKKKLRSLMQGGITEKDGILIDLEKWEK